MESLVKIQNFLKPFVFGIFSLSNTLQISEIYL